MKRGQGTTVWWIERATGYLECHHFESVPNNGSFEAEVRIKYANDPVEILCIPDRQAGNFQIWLDGLKTKAEKMREELAQKGTAV